MPPVSEALAPLLMPVFGGGGGGGAPSDGARLALHMASHVHDMLCLQPVFCMASSSSDLR